MDIMSIRNKIAERLGPYISQESIDVVPFDVSKGLYLVKANQAANHVLIVVKNGMIHKEILLKI